MAKNNISVDDVCNLLMCGSFAAMTGVAAYVFVKAVNLPNHANVNYNSSNRENSNSTSSEYQNAVDFFDDFVDDCV
nr:MAG TPA: hypothetical protein [Caudoviricetes sp.]